MASSVSNLIHAPAPFGNADAKNSAAIGHLYLPI
jgi:hypothetical protein